MADDHDRSRRGAFLARGEAAPSRRLHAHGREEARGCARGIERSCFAVVVPARLHLQEDSQVSERALRSSEQLVVRIRLVEDDRTASRHDALGCDEHDAIRFRDGEAREQKCFQN
jgi:hypothetical protein